jgi:hypothetical protein
VHVAPVAPLPAARIADALQLLGYEADLVAADAAAASPLDAKLWSRGGVRTCRAGATSEPIAF